MSEYPPVVLESNRIALRKAIQKLNNIFNYKSDNDPDDEFFDEIVEIVDELQSEYLR